MLRALFTYLGIGFLWLLSKLPYRWVARFGEGLGSLLYRLPGSRRHIVQTNLRLCFPELDAAARDRLAHDTFRANARSFAERAYIWFGSKAMLRRLVQVESAVDLAATTPRILLGMHFVGMEAGGLRLTVSLADLGVPGSASLYSVMSNPIMEAFVKRKRERFGARMVPRMQSVRDVVRQIKNGRVIYLLPDMDFGRSDAEFVPFFGIPACTLVAVSRLARLTGAEVVPVVTTLLPDYQGYLQRYLPPWDNYPGEDIVADTRRMNAFLEEQIRQHPEQYYWLHRRFKTRPPGEASLY